MSLNEIIQSWCNRCGRLTEHDILHSDNRKENISSEVVKEIFTSALCCRGCKDNSILEEYKNSDSTTDQFESFYKPPRTWFPTPNWVLKIEELDKDLYNLLLEVYSAANDEQSRLLSMGVRAALDHIMMRIVGDIGSFEEKLSKMVSEQYLTGKQKEMLDVIIDAGSAAAHRGYKPPRDLLENMIYVMDTIIRDYYITGPMLNTAKTLIPPRPPRPKKT